MARPPGVALASLAPPLATVGRPSGAALIVSLALQGLRSLRSLHPWLPSVAPPGLPGFGSLSRGSARFARSTPGYRRSPLRGCLGYGSPSRGCARFACSTPGYCRSPLRGCIDCVARSPGVPLASLAPPLATVGRPSGAAKHWVWLQGFRSLRSLHPWLPSVAPPRLPGLWLALQGLRSLRLLHPWLLSVAPPGLH